MHKCPSHRLVEIPQNTRRHLPVFGCLKEHASASVFARNIEMEADTMAHKNDNQLQSYIAVQVNCLIQSGMRDLFEQ